MVMWLGQPIKNEVVEEPKLMTSADERLRSRSPHQLPLTDPPVGL